MRGRIRIIPLWAAASLAGLAAIIVVGSIAPIRHCAFGMGILASYLMSKYYARREKFSDFGQTLDMPDTVWLKEKRLLMQGIVDRQTADLARKPIRARIVSNIEGRTAVFARISVSGQMLISTKAIVEHSGDELDFLICNAILCDRSAHWQTVNMVMTGAAFIFLLFMSEYIHTAHWGEFLHQAGIMLALITLVWIIYGTGARFINNKREWALKTAMDYTGKPLPAATAALSSSTFKDIPEGIRLKLEEIRRLGFIPQGDGDLDWLRNS